MSLTKMKIGCHNYGNIIKNDKIKMKMYKTKSLINDKRMIKNLMKTSSYQTNSMKILNKVFIKTIQITLKANNQKNNIKTLQFHQYNIQNLHNLLIHLHQTLQNKILKKIHSIIQTNQINIQRIRNEIQMILMIINMEIKIILTMDSIVNMA